MSKIIHIDSRGYCLTRHADCTYRAGCLRHLSREEAIEHWSNPEYPDPERGAGFVAAIERDEAITVLPENLDYLCLSGGTLPEGTVLPENLRYLSLGGATLPDGIVCTKSMAVLP